MHNCFDDPFDYFHSLANITASCKNLEVFSLSHSSVSLEFQYLKSIKSDYDTLRISRLGEYRFRHILAYCPDLVELNISCFPNEHLSEKCMNGICDNITWKIEKLDTTGQKYFGDKQLSELLERPRIRHVILFLILKVRFHI